LYKENIFLGEDSAKNKTKIQSRDKRRMQVFLKGIEKRKET
jgi:hypothetical protein